MSDKEFFQQKLQSTKSKHVLRAADGWLCLNEGNNYSQSTISGRHKISQETIETWRQVILNRSKFLSANAFIICLEKTAVFPHRFNGLALDENRASCQLAKIETVIYPIEKLAVNELSYHKTGTHFSDLGAYIVRRHIKWDIRAV